MGYETLSFRYFKERGIDVKDIIGDVESPDWWESRIWLPNTLLFLFLGIVLLVLCGKMSTFLIPEFAAAVSANPGHGSVVDALFRFSLSKK